MLAPIQVWAFLICMGTGVWRCLQNSNKYHKAYTSFFVSPKPPMEIFQQNGLYGLKNDCGEVIISPQYREFYPFSCGLACVRNVQYQYAYIDINNNAVVPFGKYIWLDYEFICGYARVKFFDNDHWAIIDTTGKIVSKTHYTRIWRINERYLPTIRAFHGDKRDDIILDTTSDIILDGLKYIRTFSVEEFKELVNCNVISVKMNNAHQLYIQYGANTGLVASRGIPNDPVISIVINTNGRLFALLHDKSCKQKTSNVKEEPTKQNERLAIRPCSNDQAYFYEEERDYIESSYLDAFEGDDSNYWNID